MKQPQDEWTNVIESKTSLFSLDLKEVWRYRDLIYMFVKRDFGSGFKQTVLGPLWFFINPIFTTVVYLIVFGNIANLPTDGAPKILFYLSGITLWNYFSSCLGGTSNVFVGNAGIFGKVYFPRLVMPITIVISNLMKFGVQMILFLVFFFYYLFKGEVQPNIWLLATPLLIFLMACFALGVGMIFSAMTTKYRDLQMLLTFGISLYMYATPVIYPVSTLPKSIQKYAVWNPLTGIFECFVYGWLGVGEFSVIMLVYSTIIIGVLLAIGTLIFNRVEKGFMDTV